MSSIKITLTYIVVFPKMNSLFSCVDYIMSMSDTFARCVNVGCEHVTKLSY